MFGLQRFRRIPRTTQLVSLGLLVLAIVLPCVGFFVVQGAARAFGPVGGQAALAAGLICFFGTAAALLLSRPTGNSQRDTHNLLYSIAARTLLPLAGAVGLSFAFELPLESVFGMILSYYLFALTIETWFAVRLIRHRSV